jgi:hypothetical protein
MALTGNQREAAALAIARGMSVKSAAQETRVGRRTLHRWLKEDPSFQLRVNELRAEFFSRTAGCLSELTGQAVDTLRELLASADEKVRLQAARTIFEAAGNFRDMTEWSARLSALEQRLENRSDECAR